MGGMPVGLFVLGSAKRITNKIPNAPKNPKIPAPPIKATAMEIIPWRLGTDSGFGSVSGFLIAGQVASGAHLLVPLRAHRVARLMDPFASNART